MKNQAMKHYQQISLDSAVAEASPHELVRMLMQGGLDNISRAKGSMRRGDIGNKAQCITYAVHIIDRLRGDLDLKQGGEIAQNFDALYEYMTRRLIEANVNNDMQLLDEVASLLSEMKSGWEAMPPDVCAPLSA